MKPIFEGVTLIRRNFKGIKPTCFPLQKLLFGALKRLVGLHNGD